MISVSLRVRVRVSVSVRGRRFLWDARSELGFSLGPGFGLV